MLLVAYLSFSCYNTYPFFCCDKDSNQPLRFFCCFRILLWHVLVAVHTMDLHGFKYVSSLT